MIVIRHKPAGMRNLEGLQRDTVVLNRQERRKSRQRLRTAAGLEIGLAFPTGTVMRHGDLIYVDDRRYIVVEAAEEEVIAVFPEGVDQAALVAYEIGNRHLPVCLGRGMIITPYERLMEGFLKKHSIRYECRKEVFETVR